MTMISFKYDLRPLRGLLEGIQIPYSSQNKFLVGYLTVMWSRYNSNRELLDYNPLSPDYFKTIVDTAWLNATEADAITEYTETLLSDSQLDDIIGLLNRYFENLLPYVQRKRDCLYHIVIDGDICEITQGINLKAYRFDEADSKRRRNDGDYMLN